MSNSKLLIALVAFLVIALGWLGLSYNSLVTAREQVSNAFADLDAQYQRRMDLVPNVVATVKGAARFEQSTLQSIVEARSAWTKAKTSGDVGGQLNAASSFDGALSRLLATVEAYPTLKSTEAFRDLTVTLEGSENRITVARRDYNAAVKDYNLSTRRVPMNIVATVFGFKALPFFEAKSGADEAPKIDL